MLRALTIGVEVAGHCDLRCRHCLRKDLATVNEFDVELFRRIVGEAKVLGAPHYAFTGGEASLHREFFEICRIVQEHGSTFHFVTNGGSYPRLREQLEPFRGALTGISVSLDGATEAVHDRVRGRGSYRSTCMAIALAARDGWPVTVQMVVNRHNQGELAAVARVAEQLGAGQVVYAHTQPVERASLNDLALDPEEWVALDAEVRRLAEKSRFPLGVSSGHYDPAPIAHCQTLRHESFNIDCHGRLTFCCQLSGVAGHPSDADVVADLREVSLLDAIDRHLVAATDLTRERLSWVVANQEDRYRDFHCHYCLKRFGKLAHLSPPADVGRRLEVLP